MRLPVIALLACLLPLPAAGEVKDSRPEGFTLENSALVPSSADETWDALVNHVGVWWPADPTWWGESAKGMGLDGTLEFRLAPAEEGGTRITLWYRAGGYSPDDLSAFAPVVDRVQALQLDGLVQFLRARHPDTESKQGD
ncbi:hypothetical protein [uncultured Arenimonas sp.]|uniref:hypothetical protein n=1 Tax=uncultured Arenimonas sp. TaxID=546226 RepID=UPI0030DAA0B8